MSQTHLLHLLFSLSFSSPPLLKNKKLQKYLPFSFALFSRLLSVRLCACLLAEVAMTENTKLCDFSNTNNNDFISTVIAPVTSAESYEINAALLNLVMKEQFSGLPSEDAASHLNTFIELCDMQKKKDVDNDVIKLTLFPFSVRDRAKTWFSSLPKNSIDSWNECKDGYISKYFPPAKIISLQNYIMILSNLIMNMLHNLGRE